VHVRGAVALACAVALGLAAQAGHEVSYYPSFYPQEIRIEPLDPQRAAQEFDSKTDPLHVYLGAAPRFTGKAPDHIKSVQSLDSLIMVSVNSKSRHAGTRETRCRLVGEAAALLAERDGVVAFPHPITPYHADYLHHGTFSEEARPARIATAAAAFDFRLGDRSAPFVVAAAPLAAGGAADADIDEVPVADLLHRAGVGFNAWPAPPWSKDGWFQAYHALRPVIGTDAAERADGLYNRLTHDQVNDAAEQINLERDLVAALTGGCERAIIGYRLRGDFYSDDFSNGIENLLIDSQAGFNTPVFVRTVKLKDFPWNGWLRLAIDARPTAAWNPVAGFTDAAGRLVWSAVGDNAFLPIPYNSRWVANRVEIRPGDALRTRQSFRMPSDAMVPERATGRLVPVGGNAAATDKVTYKVLASAFHDGSEMEPADFLYPYALALRWGEDRKADVFDPEIAAATVTMRERFRGARVVRVEESKIVLADLTFTYHSPIVEVYLDNQSSDPQQSALLAPPWSSVPWHVLALMEAAVERGIAAFSQSEAARRGLPWLDLVRDPAQLAKLRILIKEFAQASYRPAALEGLVTPQAAKARWEALDAFASEKGHLLVTNGPYRLRSASPEATVLDVVREFTYPVGLGTFNPYSYPPRAIVTTVARVGDGIVIAADVEMSTKAQRDRRIVRTALTRETLRDTFPIHTEARYVLIGADGKAAAAGVASRQTDGRFVAPLPGGLPPGHYTVSAAVFLDGNAFAPDIGRVSFRKD
jgi:hypothetical protein